MMNDFQLNLKFSNRAARMSDAAARAVHAVSARAGNGFPYVEAPFRSKSDLPVKSLHGYTNFVKSVMVLPTTRLFFVARQAPTRTFTRFLSTTRALREETAPNLGTPPVPKKPVGGIRGGYVCVRLDHDLTQITNEHAG